MVEKIFCTVSTNKVVMCNEQKRPRLDSRVHGQLKPLKRNKSREDDIM